MAENDELDDLGNLEPEEGLEPGEEKELSEQVEKELEEDTEKEREGEAEEGEGKEEGEKEEKEEEDDTLSGRVTYSQVKAKYPELFKDFPQLRHAFYREKVYSELFPTVEDAKEAKDKASGFEFLEEGLTSGDPTNLLQALQETNPRAFISTVQGFLPAVHQVHRDAFYAITQPLIENALKAAHKEGIETRNENLRLAAMHINRFLFGKIEFDDKPDRKNEPDPERVELERERARFVQDKARDFENSVQLVIKNELNTTIAKGIDPKNQLSKFMLSKVVEDTINRIGQVMEKDPQHMAKMNSLWKRAMKGGLSPELGKSIIQAYLSRAKEIIPSVRAKVLSEATGKPLSQDKGQDKVTRFSGDSRVAGGAPKVSAKDVDWSKTTDEDFLKGNITLKK